MKTADLTLQTFCRYVAEFMRCDKLADGTTTPSSMASSLRFEVLRDESASVGDMLVSALPYSFSLVYLQCAPDLRYLARRIILRLERHKMKDYLRQRKELKRSGGEHM